jgi:hypothetical protein
MSNVNPAPVALPRRLLAEAVGTGLLITPTSFANPAVTVGRVFTDTFAGITPGSVRSTSVPRSSVPPWAWFW